MCAMTIDDRNISDSLKKCGVSESTTRLALVFIDPTEEDLAVLQQIGGELKDICELGTSIFRPISS